MEQSSEAATLSSPTSKSFSNASDDETATLSTLKDMFQPDSDEVTKQNDNDLVEEMRKAGKTEAFIADFMSGLRELDKADDERHEDLKQGQEKILDGVEEVGAKLDKGVDDLKEGQGKIREGVGDVKEGVDDLKDGQTKLQDGVADIKKSFNKSQSRNAIDKRQMLRLETEVKENKKSLKENKKLLEDIKALQISQAAEQKALQIKHAAEQKASTVNAQNAITRRMDGNKK